MDDPHGKIFNAHWIWFHISLAKVHARDEHRHLTDRPDVLQINALAHEMRFTIGAPVQMRVDVAPMAMSGNVIKKKCATS